MKITKIENLEEESKITYINNIHNMKKENKIIEAKGGEYISQKRDIITINHNSKLLEFKYPNKLTYKNVLDKLKEDDTAGAFEILFDDCLNQLDNNFEFDDKIGYFTELSSNFLSFKEADIIYDNNIYTVSINSKEFKIRKPNREEIKHLFNLSIKSSVDALGYIYNNLKIEGYIFNMSDINDIVDYYSLHQLSGVLIYNKSLDLKKK